MSSSKTPEGVQPRISYRTCSLCEATCGLAIEVQGDRVVRVRGDDEDVFSRGYICPKGAQIGALHHDPDRLRAPLVKRDGQHVEVGWAEAFAEVEAGFNRVVEKYGRSALAAYAGNPNAHNFASSLFLGPLLKSLGTRNLFSASTIDQMPRHVSSGLMFGGPMTVPIVDIDRTDYLLMLGANPFESNGSLLTAPDLPGRLRSLVDRGAKLVVVDPRTTRTAEIATEHVRIRPGTDALFLVSLANVLIDEGLVALGEVASHISGADQLDAALADFTPERVAAACGLDSESIRRIARELAASPSAGVYGRIGTHTTEFGTLASWAADVLIVLTGNLDRAGGALFPRPAHMQAGTRRPQSGFSVGRWKSRVKGYGEALGEFPVATLVDEIETTGEGQTRALFTIAGNPVLSTPDSSRLDRALAGLDFMVSVDIYLNETTRHADVILPPPSPLERSQYDGVFYQLAVRNIANYSPPTFEPQGPTEADILAKLALIVGGEGAEADPSAVHALVARGLAASVSKNEMSPACGKDVEEILAATENRSGADRVLDIQLRGGARGDGFGASPGGLSLDVLEANPHGLDLGALEPSIPEALSTVSASVELAPTPIIEDLARLKERIDRPEAEFLLVGRRHLRSNNSWMHNIKPLVTGRERCTLHVNPADAARLGLESNEMARVTSEAGSLETKVEVTDAVMPGVVSLPHGWGHSVSGSNLGVAAAHAGVNSNVLTPAVVADPLSGNAALNAIPVGIAATS